MRKVISAGKLHYVNDHCTKIRKQFCVHHYGTSTHAFWVFLQYIFL